MRMLLCLLLAIPLFGFTYNQLQLNAQAAIFPKLLLLNKHPDTLLSDGKIRFTIAYEPQDILTATSLKARMERLYPDQLEGFRFEVSMVPFERIASASRSSALYILHTDTALSATASMAQAHKITTFVYDVSDLGKGFLFSLVLERRTVLYLNRAMLAVYGIEFTDPLYQIVRFFDEKAP